MAISNFPYDLLRNGRIGPSSSAKEINNFDVGPNPDLRDAWHVLKTRKTRLEIDFLLYDATDRDRVLSCRHLIQAGNNLMNWEIASLEEQVGDDVAVLLIMLGRRDDALRWLQDAQRKNPLCARTTHRLALSCYASARHCEEVGNHAQADEMWRLAMANWIRAVLDEQFWNSWCETRERVYGIESTDRSWDDEKEEVRGSLLNRMFADLSRLRDESLKQASEARAAAIEELMLLYQVESNGAKVLRDYGGLTIGDRAIACGPMMMKSLNLQDELSKLAREQFDAVQEYDQIGSVNAIINEASQLESGESSSSRGAIINREHALQLRWYFSELGRGAALLEMNCPNDVAQALPESMSEARDNPGYSSLPANGGPAFRTDRLQLELRAQLAIARASLIAANPNVDAARAAWRKALRISRGRHATTTLRSRTIEEISRLALGRVETLNIEDANSTDPVDIAMNIFDAAYDLIGDQDGGEVARQYSEALVIRGDQHHQDYSRFSEDQIHTQNALESLRKTQECFRQAHELNQQDLDIRRIYCEILALRADHCPDQAEAIEYLEEAVRIAEVGLSNSEGSERLENSLSWIKGTLDARRGPESDSMMGDAYDELNDALRRVNGCSDANTSTDASHHEDISGLIQSGERNRSLCEYQTAVAELQEALKRDTEGVFTAWATAEITLTYIGWVEWLLVLKEYEQALTQLDFAMEYNSGDARLNDLRARINAVKSNQLDGNDSRL